LIPSAGTAETNTVANVAAVTDKMAILENIVE